MDQSDFFPAACSTVNRKKSQRQHLQRDFEEENSLLLTNNSHRENRISEASYDLEEQKNLAKNSLQRATKVSGIPSKYLRSNSNKSESQFDIDNESTVSESDLLQTPKNASTPRTSIAANSFLKESLAQLSFKVTDSNISIDHLVNDFKKVFRNVEEQTSSIFRPAEEAASMLLADEMSWRQKNELPIQDEHFSELINYSGTESLGAFFQKKCNKLSEFPGGVSPNITREPIALIEPSLSLAEENVSIENNEKRSLSISTIQRFLSTEETPKRTIDNLYKLESKPELVSLENKLRYSLPVSKNSSYTSDHSENEAMKLICNKENINSLNNKNSSNGSSPSSRTSSRASSSLSSLQNDKLPIDTSKCDLVWGCVKVGKSVTQEFIIRNRSPKRLCLQLSLCRQEYKIRKDGRNESVPLSANKLVLHPHESKSVIVSFIPTKIGAAVDELYFTLLDPNIKQTKKQCVKLYGYGGSYKVDFQNLTRDTTGKFWLSLGKLDDRSIIRSQFHVKNKGDIPVFIHISINSLETSKLHVDPHFFVLSAQEEKEIGVSYKPSSEDYNFLHKSLHTTMVVDLGGLNITFGAEADRGRIRTLFEKCVKNGLKIPPIVNVLKEQIEGELMPIDLYKFKEPPGHLNEIVKLLNHHQIILTLERDPEQTIIQQFPDDSGLYQSLYQDTTVICNKSEIQHSCFVTPTILVLTLPYKHKDFLFLKSENQHKLNFIASCQHNDLELRPREGILDPHGTVIITVKYLPNLVMEKRQFKVVIIVESKILEVDVTVESLGNVKSKNKSVLNCMF